MISRLDLEQVSAAFRNDEAVLVIRVPIEQVGSARKPRDGERAEQPFLAITKIRPEPTSLREAHKLCVKESRQHPIELLIRQGRRASPTSPVNSPELPDENVIRPRRTVQTLP